jgi:competence protein ComGC
MKCKPKTNRGLSFVDVLIVLATIGLLLLYASTMNTAPKARSSRINCVSNLKQIGLAMRLFAIDHEGNFPWQASLASGGTFGLGANDPTLHFLALSNELISPKVLFCVCDRQRSSTTNFAGLSRANISYFVGLDASNGNPQAILSGDRNLTGGTLSNSILTFQTWSNQACWGKSMHNGCGNIGLGDGSAQQVTDLALNKQLRMNSNQTIRLLIP